MLTQEKIDGNEKTYMGLLAELGIDLTDLTIYLNAVDYFNKPANAQYFGAYPGGLCQYALNVFAELSMLAEAYFPGRYQKQDLIKVALLKDIYRAELYEPYQKNVKNDETGQWESQLAYKYREIRPTFGDLGFSSYMIAKKFVDLTDEQVEAITQADAKESYGGDIHDIMRSYPLVTLTKMANIAAMYIDEAN